MRDKEDLAALIGKKTGISLDKTDPVFTTATIFEALAKEAMTDLAKIVTDAADQISTASVLAENNAR
ncbi:MAG: hypothetical protein M3Y22_15315, partial [Pseudomonadota bacterium]|nr:hypothetical protein [Pseudomonadota bacterium]